MQLDDYLRQVHDQLGATAALADERTQQIAAGLAAGIGPSVRLAILQAVAAAADEITAALLDAPGSPRVGVRLDGDDLRVEVSTPEPEPAAPRTDEGEASARISLRLSEALKAEVEQAAGRDGVSVNTWLVRAASGALSTPRGWAGPGFALGAAGAPGGGRRGNAHHISGWING
jgi:hypothetical protein